MSDHPDPELLLDIARQAAAAGAEVATTWWGRLDTLEIEQKADPDDLVSRADRETELAIRAELTRHRPTDPVIGEEYGGALGSAAVSWAVDPIDGTTSFLYGRADWSVSVAALSITGDVLAGIVLQPALGLATSAARGSGAWENGRRLELNQPTELRRALVEVNLGRGPQRDRSGRLFDALVPRVRDIRRGGSAAVALANVAAGRADAAWSPGLQVWDCAAGVALVAEAGGLVGDLGGPSPAQALASGDVLAAPESMWSDLHTILRDVYGPPE